MQIIDMNRNGDTRHEFKVGDQAEIAKAMEVFNKLIGQGKFASVPAKDGGSGRLIKEFDPTAETIIFRNQNVGG